MLLDGKPVARRINEATHEAVRRVMQTGRPAPQLSVLTGTNPPGEVLGYLKMLRRACENVGLSFTAHEAAGQAQALGTLARLGEDPETIGIIVALPIPEYMDALAIKSAIAIEKDIDCAHPLNIGRLFIGSPGHRPCTPGAVMVLLDAYNIPLRGRHAVIIGRSNIVGKPMAHMLLERGCTITICHTDTPSLAEHLRRADIVVAASGRPWLVTPDMLREGTTIIDIGTNYTEGSLKGDVHPGCAERAAHFTPVPGGVGPVTTALLVSSCLPKRKENQ